VPPWGPTRGSPRPRSGRASAIPSSASARGGGPDAEAAPRRERPLHPLGPFGEDSDPRRHGEKIAQRGGKKSAKKRAVVVAVARKLSVLLHHPLWISGEAYEPFHNARHPEEGGVRLLEREACR
jgi:hypothetical protein